MGINAIQNNSVYQTEQKVQSSQKQQTQPTTDTDKTNGLTDNQLPHDEYISSEKSLEKPSGLYKVVPDENGKHKITYDNPEKCTTNTDRTDREIEKLKEKKEQLEQQIKSAAGDEKKIKELERKLSGVESEISQKDNDAYRRKNSVVS